MDRGELLALLGLLDAAVGVALLERGQLLQVLHLLGRGEGVVLLLGQLVERLGGLGVLAGGHLTLAGERARLAAGFEFGEEVGVRVSHFDRVDGGHVRHRCLHLRAQQNCWGVR